MCNGIEGFGCNMGGSAKILGDKEFKTLLRRMRGHRQQLRNITICLLSFKAGLRACEIAGLDWAMITTAGGAISDSIAIGGSIAKNGRPRRVPLHPELRTALTTLSKRSGTPRSGPVIRSQRGGHMTPGSVVNWFTVTYNRAGLSGCSSHSGRRTFITRSARMLAKVGGSLRDIQELAGHSALSSTEAYMVGDRVAQHRLVHLL